MSNLPPKAEWSLLKSWLRLLPHSSTRHDGLLQLKTATPRKPETEPYSTCAPIAALFRRNNLLRTISGQPATESHTNDLSYGKTDCVSLPHRRDLASWKHQSTIQYTFAIQQPRPQHLPRGLAQRIFSQPPRLSTSRLPLPHGSPRRSAKNALLYVTPLQPKNARSWRADIWAIAFESLILSPKLCKMRSSGWPYLPPRGRLFRFTIQVVCPPMTRLPSGTPTPVLTRLSWSTLPGMVTVGRSGSAT